MVNIAMATAAWRWGRGNFIWPPNQIVLIRGVAIFRDLYLTISSIFCSLCMIHTSYHQLDLTRQYKTMQAQLENRLEFLEAQVRRLQKTLGKRKTFGRTSV